MRLNAVATTIHSDVGVCIALAAKLSRAPSREDAFAAPDVDAGGVSAMYSVGSPRVVVARDSSAFGDFDARDIELAIRASTSASAMLASELEFASRRGSEDDVRSRGRALASKYWVGQLLDVEDELDASADGFYDVWGDAFETSESGKLPELAELLNNNRRFESDEAIVVDRRTDMFLDELDELARQMCAMAPTTRSKCALLARFVSDRMGGATALGDEDPMLAAEVARDREQVLGESKGCAVHVGHLSKGQERHRAVLFKALASAVHLPCRLVRGEFYCGSTASTRSAKIILAIPGEDEWYWVDLMACPGLLRSCADAPGANTPNEVPPTPTPYDPNRVKQRAWSATRAKGKTPISPASASDSSLEDLLAFASFATPPPSPTTTSSGTREVFFDSSGGIDDEIITAVAIAHGVSTKSARTAMALSGDVEKANYLCNCVAIGSALEEEFRRVQSGERSTSESILLQDMFNILSAKRWMVNDAIEAYRARRCEEIDVARIEAFKKAPLAIAPESVEEKMKRDAQRLRELDDELQRARVETMLTQAKRRENKQQRAKDELMQAAEVRVERFRENHAKTEEEYAQSEELRVAFREEWFDKVTNLSLSETLECFGVTVEDGSRANAKQLRKAYRAALLQFHPDRQRDKTLRERIYAEEMFKLISHKAESHA